MRVLVVGGTGFLGGAITAAALGAGHEVTVLSRRGQGLPPGARHLAMDRHEGRPIPAPFDWVLDTCAFTPGDVTGLMDALPEPPARYVFASSISAYPGFAAPGLDETADVPPASPETVAEVEATPPDQRSAAGLAALYGPLKRATELAAEARLGSRATALRLGLLVGPGDPTGRFTFWVRRIDLAGAGGTVPVPAPPEAPVQIIDMRDAARFALQAAASGLGGIWNVTGRGVPRREVFGEIARVAGTTPDWRWVTAAQMDAAGVAPWSDMPLALPDAPDFAHMMALSTAKAEAAGLVLRPLGETIADILAHDRAARAQPLKAGMSAAQEAALLA
ncbi:NAD-dependent epimerase/dehydratase family protein [Pseudoroseicyclus sp. CXY001]|uniref:NAD-dependent epimerase/dehydratase family protein n=1 Tax=Pseudoroseicyclus sp. CXY001 TaxID=3242492 RepID=UPI003570C49E